MGDNLCDFVPAEKRDTLKNLIAQGGQRSIRAEMTLVRDGGKGLPTQLSLNPVNLEESASIGVVVTDLSERKRNEHAEAEVRMRDEFLAIASHELRTPLSTLVLRLGLLERHAEKGDLKQIQSSIRRAGDQTERMSRLVDRLLDVSQLASGRLKVDLSPCDLSRVIKDVAERFQEEALNGGSEIRLTVANGVSTRADRFRLDEAIGNVISNAIKYGAGRPIEIQLKTKNEKAILVVQDRGIGIPIEDLSRIFGRFERTAATQNYGGLGLGLYIAHQIIEQHDGSIRAERRSGGGARIVIELPVNAISGRNEKE
jgi:signal transduction histidine kinase